MKFLLCLLFSIISISVYSQQKDIVDFKRIEADLNPNFENQTITGNLKIDFLMLTDSDSIFLDANNISEYKVKINSGKLKSSFDGEHLIFKGEFDVNKEYQISLNYTASPNKALYFVNKEGENQLWTQGQGKYTSNWLPSIDDMNDKIEFDFSITAPKNYEVIANGKLKDTIDKGESRRWDFDMHNPISSYLAALVIGDYKKQTLYATSGVPIELYYYPEDSTEFEPTYRYTKEIFDFFEAEIGVPYPWQNYKEVPVKDFLYAGMENTSATIFSDVFMVDDSGFPDRNYVNVNAHELAHQWFGDLVTETTGTHHWLQEGFATYYALLAEREIFGENYYYWQLYQTAEQLKELSDKGKGEKLLNPGASSLTFYQKGAWALHILREQIGDEAFKKAVKSYLEKHRFENVETSDFLEAAREASGQDLIDFEKDWLNQSAFQATPALESLKKSSFIQDYLQINRLRKISFDKKKELLRQTLTLPDDYIGQEAVYQLAGEPISETLPLYELGFNSNNRFVRQAIAISVSQVPEALRADYETLLNDDSYVTREAALMALWASFPNHRNEYLDKLEGIVGFADKNIETLWLALSLATPDYKENLKQQNYQQLVNYTGEEFSFEIREHAFQYLYQLQLYEEQSLTNLVSGCLHHNWRFAQSCRGILDMLLEDTKWKTTIKDLNGLTDKETKFLTQKLQ